MALCEPQVTDVANRDGQSLPRDENDPGKVLCAQESLRDVDGNTIEKEALNVRQVVDEAGTPFPTDGNGNQILVGVGGPHWTITEGLDGALTFVLLDSGGVVIAGPFTESDTDVVEISPGVYQITDDSGDVTTITPGAAPIDHHTISNIGVLSAQPANLGFLPMDNLVAEGAGLQEVADTTFTVTNTTGRMMQMNLLIGLHIEVFQQTTAVNSIYTQGKYDISGIVGGPIQLLGHTQFRSIQSLGISDQPSLTPTTAAFVIAPGATATIRAAMEQNLPDWDGVSVMASVSTRWNLFGSTMEI